MQINSLVLIGVLSVLLGGTAVSANEDSTGENSRSQSEELPYFVKYGAFVGTFSDVFGAQLASQLSANDHGILSYLAETNADWELTESVKYNAELVDFCSARAGKAAVSLAKQYDGIAARSNERRAARYRKAIDSLSTQGKALVEQFVEEKIAAQIRMSVPSVVPLATSDPDEFNFSLDNACQRILYGEYSPEHKAALEKGAEETRVKLEQKLQRLADKAKETNK